MAMLLLNLDIDDNANKHTGRCSTIYQHFNNNDEEELVRYMREKRSSSNNYSNQHLFLIRDPRLLLHHSCQQQLPCPVDGLGQGEEGDSAEESHDAANVGDHVNRGDSGSHQDLHGGALNNVDTDLANVVKGRLADKLNYFFLGHIFTTQDESVPDFID